MGGSFLQKPIKDVQSQIFTSEIGNIYSVQVQGWRRYMQDAKIVYISKKYILLGVFDGHGGLQVSNVVSKLFVQIFQKKLDQKMSNINSALRLTFNQFDIRLNTQQVKKLVKQIRFNKKITDVYDQVPSSGTTANVVIITQKKIYCANAGDSRSVLSRGGKAIPLSDDHKPGNTQQYKRITKAGGIVSEGRIDMGLNLSRAIGDLQYKSNKTLKSTQQKVISDPDINQLNRDPKDQFIIMGCDGIWQRYVDNNQGMVDQIKTIISQPNVKQTLSQYIVSNIAVNIGEYGCDNMTAILIQFQ